MSGRTVPELDKGIVFVFFLRSRPELQTLAWMCCRALASLPCWPVFWKCQVKCGLSEKSVWTSDLTLQLLRHVLSPEASSLSLPPAPRWQSIQHHLKPPGSVLPSTFSRMTVSYLCFELSHSDSEWNYLPYCCNKTPPTKAG